jgi:hypothetical protein
MANNNIHEREKSRWIVSRSAILFVCLVYGGSTAVLVPLVKIVQHRAITPAQCLSRQTECGFVGNSDLYGLGIRLGLYLQWFASWLANIWLKDERRGLAETYMVFSLALFIALFVATFQDTCTYIAEIITILFIFFGGCYVAVGPVLDLTGDFGELLVSQVPERKYKGLEMSWLVVQMPTAIYNCWFWIRMAMGSGTGFTHTPCGTSFFLLARVTSSHLRPASGFMAFISLMLISLVPSVSNLFKSEYLNVGMSVYDSILLDQWQVVKPIIPRKLLERVEPTGLKFLQFIQRMISSDEL